jgi:hypothetical protein
MVPVCPSIAPLHAPQDTRCWSRTQALALALLVALSLSLALSLEIYSALEISLSLYLSRSISLSFYLSPLVILYLSLSFLVRGVCLMRHTTAAYDCHCCLRLPLLPYDYCVMTIRLVYDDYVTSV